MAEKIYPVASSNHIYYTSDIQNLNKALIKDKTLILSTSLKVTAKTSPDMTVSISSGSAFNNGMFYQNSTTVSLTISSNTGSLPRKDAICIEFNGANSKLVVTKGTPTTSPVISSTATDSNHILLAEVLVGVGATSIQTSNITDKRNYPGQYILESLDKSIHMLEDKVKNLEDGKMVTYYNHEQNDNYILNTNLMEFKETGMKISSMYFYLSPNYIASTKVGGRNYSAVTLSYFYSIGTTYSVSVNLSAGQAEILSGKFSGDVIFTTPTSKGFNIYIPNNTDDAYGCTLFINVVGK
nr:MAG TPA: Receptor Binding Protein [Caudoviricetes sp.]